MPTRLPLNLHHRAHGEALAPMFEAYYVPAVPPAQWGDQDAVAAQHEAREKVRQRIERELLAGGAEPDVARLAANSFDAFGFAPNYGLSTAMGAKAVRAEAALDKWASGIIAANRARKAA
jgi:hypothetical protein